MPCSSGLLGYKFEETTKESVKNAETGEKKMVVTKVVTKDVQPDVTAQIFWLKKSQAGYVARQKRA